MPKNFESTVLLNPDGELTALFLRKSSLHRPGLPEATSEFATKTFSRKVDALEWKSRELHKLRDAKVGREKGHSTTLNDFFEDIYWKHKNVRDGTAVDYRRVYESHFKEKLGDRFLCDLDENDFAEILFELERKGTSPARINRIHASLSAVMSFAVKWSYVLENPLKKIPYHKEGIKGFDYWSEHEAYRFLSWAKKAQCPRFVLYQTAYELGLRMEEIVALTRDCINFHQKQLHVRQSFCKASKRFLPMTKSGHERILGLNDGLAHELMQLLGSHADDFIFLNHKGERITHDSLRHHFRRDQEKAGVRLIRFHDLRHSFASHFMMKGGNIYDLKALLGHSDISTTMRYAHLSPDHLKKQASLVSFRPDSVEVEQSGKVLSLDSVRSISAPRKKPHL